MLHLKKTFISICNLQDTTTAVVKNKPKVFSKDWFKNVLQFPCVSAETENLMLGEEDDEDEQTEENKPDIIENKQEPEKVAENVDVMETVTEEEEVYEPINVTAAVEVEVESEVQEPERSPTPDPLRALGAQLLSQLNGYKEDFNKFSNVMEEHKPEMDVEEPGKENENETGTPLEHRKLVTKENNPELDVKESLTNNENVVQLESEKLVTEEEKRMVKNMSNGDAWNHVLGSVLMVSVKKTVD